MPSPTAWPFVLAAGVTLMFAGLATAASISVLGIVLAICGAIGWFRDVLPEESQESVPVSEMPRVADRASLRLVRPLPARASLPREIYPVSAGLRGGLAGGAAMALLAMAYGAIAGPSVWYPINLLAAGFLPHAMDASTAALAAFDLEALALATAVHLIASLLVGLLYGAMLPMLPRRPIVLGGIVAPLFWSGLLYGILGIVNPLMNERIDWVWFVLSQIGFGTAAGLVVSRLERVPTKVRARPVPLVMLALFAITGAPSCNAVSPATAAAGDSLAAPAPATSAAASADRTPDFAALYRTNCAGCHGVDGRGGAALALADPVYLAIADDAVLRRATAAGVRGTAMPAFARRAGGSLSDAEVDAIVSGIRGWSRQPDGATARADAGFDPPPYADSTPGDAERGAAVFETFCARCHGAAGRGGPAASSIVDASFLSLVSDQGLRTTVIAGRPELGAPDWQGNVPGRPMTPPEVSDVVAWLSAQRPRSGDSAAGSRP